MNFDLTTEQQKIQTVARQFAEQEVAPISREADEQGVFPAHLVPRMADLGLFAIPITDSNPQSAIRNPQLDRPQSYIGYALICEELGRVDSSVRGFLTVHVGLVAGCIAEWGTPEQKARFLPLLTSGEWIGCYALTEPNAGSDVASMECSARQDGDTYVLNGEKIWITNGTSAARGHRLRHQGPLAQAQGHLRLPG